MITPIPVAAPPVIFAIGILRQLIIDDVFTVGVKTKLLSEQTEVTGEFVMKEVGFTVTATVSVFVHPSAVTKV